MKRTLETSWTTSFHHWSLIFPMWALVVVSSIFSSSSCRWDEQDEERFLDTRQQSNRAKRGTKSSVREEGIRTLRAL